MKFQIILLISILFFLMSCGKGEGQKEKKEDQKPLEEQIDDHIKKELAKGIENDTIVLDFLFGMTKKDVYKHTKKLASKDKMYPIQKSKRVREYVYDLRLRKAGKIRTFFEAFYYDNKELDKDELYKVECLPKIDTTVFKPLEIIAEIRPIFEAEYGNYDFVVPDKEDKDCKTYLWINGNQKIELGCFEEKVFIYYTDIPLEKLAAKASDL